MKYIGIDLHATNSVIAIVDAQERILYCKRRRNRLEDILVVLRAYQDSGCVVAVESTYNWYWLIDGLKVAGFDVRLANSAALPQYQGLKYSDDETDAITLARLLARGILPEGYIYPVNERGVRDLLRRRLVLVRARNSSSRSMEYSPVISEKRQAVSVTRRSYWLAHLKVRETLDGEVAALEEHLADRLAKREDVCLLKSVPGIGSILASRSRSKLGTSVALPMQDISPPTAGWSRVREFPMASARVTATRNAAPLSGLGIHEAALFAKRSSREAQGFYRKCLNKRHKLIALKRSRTNSRARVTTY
jgi:transposase